MITAPITGTVSRLASKPVIGEPVEMRRRIGRRRKARRSPRTATSVKTGIVQRGSRSRQICAVQRGKARDQRDGRGKGHLEARLQQAFGLGSSSSTSAASATDRSVSARRSSSTAPSMTAIMTKARSVATLAPGQEQVEQRHRQRDHRRDLLGVHPQRDTAAPAPAHSAPAQRRSR